MTDERDPKVSQRYRQLPGEEPSRELDQAILSAAHRSVDRPHAPLVVPAGRHRWYYSLAAAAVLVLAIAVTVHVEHQQPDAELAEAPPPAPAPAPAEQPKRDTPMWQERRQAYTPEPPRVTAAPAPAPAESAAARRDAEAKVREEQAEQNVEALKKERAAGDVAARRAPPAPYAAAAITPERELERIAELRKQGRDDEADKALAEFRKRYPDYVISDEMKAKVERR